MSDESNPTGLPYSRLYLRPTEPHKEIPNRARVRFGAIAFDVCGTQLGSVAAALQRSQGLQLPYFGGSYLVGRFFESAPTAEVLDALTGIFSALRPSPMVLGGANFVRPEKSHARWLEQCRAVLAEETLGYRMDDDGGVHPLVDTDFEGSRVAVLKLLGDARYRNVHDCFETAHRHFEARAPDYKAAVWSIFQALESLLRLATGRTLNLSRASVRDHLGPLISSIQGGKCATESGVVAGMVESFGVWADCLHAYRHGQGVGEAVAPSAELAAFVLSSGAAYLRWLLEFDQQLLRRGPAVQQP